MKCLFLSLLLIWSFSSFSANSSSLSIESFASLKSFSRLQLSPNGENLAFVRNMNGDLVLMIYNIESGSFKSILKSDNQTIFFDWYKWANDDVLLLGARYIERQRGGLKYASTRLLSYNIKNKESIKVATKPNYHRDERQPQFEDQLLSLLPEKKDTILIQADYHIPNMPAVYELDLNNQKKKKIQRARSNVINWTADRQGKVRIAKRMEEDQFEYEFLNLESGDWEPLFAFKAFSNKSVTILGFDKNPNFLYIKAIHTGRDAIFKVDLITKKRELIYSDEKYDVDGSIFYSPKTGEVAGFTHSHLPDGVQYWDPDLTALHTAVRGVLPADEYYVNILNTSEDQQKYVLFMSSDSTSGQYLLGDRSSNTLSVFASDYPDIDETVYRGKERITFKARDGLQIEGYLTLPTSYKKGDILPTIIFPHGGPMARDYAGFDYWTALLAYHGYAVLQPNFRGSSGYGYEFLMQSVQGYGQAMQDDLQDSALWLVEQGIANKDKICIGGASYGGYAALMAIVKHPETFKCAASFAGLTDLERVVSQARHFTNNEIVRKQFGTDGDILEKSSPVNHAKQINRPVLLVHGSDDNVVPIYHSREMQEELEDEEKDVTYIELEDGDHYLSYQPHRIKTLQAFLDFFDKHLK